MQYSDTFSMNKHRGCAKTSRPNRIFHTPRTHGVHFHTYRFVITLYVLLLFFLSDMNFCQNFIDNNYKLKFRETIDLNIILFSYYITVYNSITNKTIINEKQNFSLHFPFYLIVSTISLVIKKNIIENSLFN